MSKKAAGYGRVSTVGQIKGTSRAEQKSVIAKECKRLDYKLVEFYEDVYSGKDTVRPGLQRLIADAKERKFDAILFTKLDRLGRSLLDILNLWKIFTEELGLQIICIQEPSLNSAGSMGKILLAVLGSFAEFERERIRERTISGRMTAWKESKAIIGNLPYAYYFDSDKQEILVNEEQKTIYEKIVSLYVDEHRSMIDISNILTKQGIDCPSTKYKTGKAHKWNQTTVRKILNKRSYMGEMVSNQYQYVTTVSKKTGRQYQYASKIEKPEEEWVRIKLPPLISQDRFQRIQDRIQNQKASAKKSYEHYKERFLLGNMIYCGECNSKMHRRIRELSGGGATLSYRCFWRHAGKKKLLAEGRKKCNLPAVDVDKVDKRVYKQIVDFLVNPDRFVEQFYEDVDSVEIEKRLNRLQKQKVEIKKTLGRYYELYGIVDGEAKTDLVAKVRKLNDDLSSVQKNLTEAEKEYNFATDKRKRLEEFKDSIRKQGSLRKEVRTFLNGLSFKDKKRITEAVIAPEQGGQVIVRFATGIDLLDHEDLKALTAEEFKELSETKHPERKPIMELHFKADLSRILTLANSLKSDNFLENLYFHTVPRP